MNERTERAKSDRTHLFLPHHILGQRAILSSGSAKGKISEPWNKRQCEPFRITVPLGLTEPIRSQQIAKSRVSFH